MSIRKLFLAFFAAAVLVPLAAPQPADAKLKLVSKPVRFLNTHVSRVAGNAYDTLYTAVDALADTTVAVGIGDMVVNPAIQYSASTTDTASTIAWMVLYSDSTAVPTLTALTMTVQGVAGVAPLASGTGATISASETVPYAITANTLAGVRSFTSGFRVFQFPITVGRTTMTSFGSTNLVNPLGFPAWRFIFGTASGIAGTVRAQLVYYTEE